MQIDPKKIVGENIRRLRTQVGWSQEELAEVAGLHRTYIGAIERGERNVSLENIVGIAHALQVKPSELLKGIS